MSSRVNRPADVFRTVSKPSGVRRLTLCCLAAALLAGCATSSSLRRGQHAERGGDFDRAVVEYTRAIREKPDNRSARQGLERVRIRASQNHFFRGRRLAAADRFEEALVEFQLASELNPTDAAADAALRDTRQRLRTKVAVSRGGKTELQALIERSRELGPPGLELPPVKLPDTLVFSNAGSRAVFTALARFAGISVVFDPTFRDSTITVDLRNVTLPEALASLTASTRTFYRVTAQKTVTIIPDTPAKRREYEEAVVATFFLSNADVKEVIDLLRIVVDVRQISPITTTNSISLKDTPERIEAASKLIAAIDKARPEVVIDVELLEIDRARLREYGLQIASPLSEGSPSGLSGSLEVDPQNLTLDSIRKLTRADVFITGVPAIYYRLLKTDSNTRTLANPQLRTSEGIAAQARFGDRVPVPVTQFAPIATGGVNQQPITSFQYENIGVNIDILPRTHHNDDVSLSLKVSLSSVSGTGFGGLPTFANREITTTIRLKDGETNMLAGLIRDEERTSMAGIPWLSDFPILGRFFANTQRTAQETDIVLTLTPHIVRVLDLSESDLRPFRLGRDLPGVSLPEQREPAPPRDVTPRDRGVDQLPATTPGGAVAPQPSAPSFPQPLQPAGPFPQPLPGTLPGANVPIPTPPPNPKKPGG